jgi:hypothetical protein
VRWLVCGYCGDLVVMGGYRYHHTCWDHLGTVPQSLPCLVFTQWRVMFIASVLSCWRFWQDASLWTGEYPLLYLAVVVISICSNLILLATNDWEQSLSVFCFWGMCLMHIRSEELCAVLCKAPGQSQSSHWSGGLLHSYITLMHSPKWLTLHWMESTLPNHSAALLISSPFVYRYSFQHPSISFLIFNLQSTHHVNHEGKQGTEFFHCKG